MTWNNVQAEWKQFAGHAKREWGELTDDDLSHIDGNRDILEGKLQERYGDTKEAAQKKVDEWVDKL